jgi:16S rRNA (guanine527-N7)-methyltransferase
MRAFRHQLLQRAALSDLTIHEGVLARLEAYYDLLERWNEKINLTSRVDPDEALDRLLLEPLAAATHLTSGARLLDLGSGGGSPAIPLALACSAPRLVMVESRERKTAFLREVIRQLEFSDVASVEACRFEALGGRDGFQGGFDAVSIRGVRLNSQLLTLASGFLSQTGVIALFRGPVGPDQPEGLPPQIQHISTSRLLKQSTARLSLLGKT